MKIKSKEVTVAIYFLLAVLLITWLYPREGKFRYQYTKGKPWKYGLLTAPFDFPIYKPEAEVKKEQDSIMKAYIPYFYEEKEVVANKLKLLEADYQAMPEAKENKSYYLFLREELESVYALGIVSRKGIQTLEEHHFKTFNKRENTRVHEVSLENVYTVQTAYVHVTTNIPSYLDPQQLLSWDINKYIAENLLYDKETSEKVKAEKMKQVSLANGMVQAGERIVDRGVIIDSKTYDILNSLKTISQNRLGSAQRQGWILGGIFIITGGLLLSFFLYLFLFRRKYFDRRKDVVFLLANIASFVLLTELAINYNLFNVYIIPYMIVPIVICTFFDTRTALFSHLTMVLMCAMMVPFPSEFLILQIVGGMTVVFGLKDLTERSQLIRCSFFVLIAYSLFYTGLTLFQEGNITKVRWQMFMYFGINFIFLMFTYALVYFVEKMFGYISNVSLVELSNINSPLLKKLSEVCPGTFQHSLQVSILAAAAADKIGANIQLTRTGALYHDIGKMENPTYFTENQSGYNPHDKLDFEESAKIIIGHVKDGERLAQKHNIPQQIIDFILTHHGAGKAKYFYHSFKNAYPDKPVNEESFTYPGPNPFSKETAILMMADSVEAASRSLPEYTDETISNLIDKIIDGKTNDGLMNNTPLTFRNVEEIKAVFNEKLRTMYHTRISYPELKNEEESKKE